MRPFTNKLIANTYFVFAVLVMSHPDQSSGGGFIKTIVKKFTKDKSKSKSINVIAS